MPGKSHERRSLVGYSPWGRKESDTTEQLHFLSCLEGRLRPVQCVLIEQSMPGPFLVPGGQPSLWKLPLSPSSLRILRLCLQMSLHKVILLVSEGILFDLKNFALLQICWAGLSHCFLAISSPLLCLSRSRRVRNRRTEVLPSFSHFLSLLYYSFVLCFTLGYLFDSIWQACYTSKKLPAYLNV